jgi:glycosyltransferase involved in cell wall biosynthesis
LKFGIITPVFDGCLESLGRLFEDIRGQTHHDWTWILCNNGHSEKIAAFAREKNALFPEDNRDVVWRLNNFLRPKVAYVKLRQRDTPDVGSLLIDIGRRRDRCIRMMSADYIFMLDADAKLLDPDMFRSIAMALEKTPKDVCIYRIIHDIGVLPIFPIGYGRIDMLNFCIKADLARRIGYPTDLSPDGVANDYRYFDRAMKATGGDYLFIDRVFGQHNGNNNNSYINLMKQIAGQCPSIK